MRTARPNQSFHRTRLGEPRSAGELPLRHRKPSLRRTDREFRYALNGFSSGTPKALKAATFLVTTVNP